MSTILKQVQIQPLLAISQKWISSAISKLPMKVHIDICGQKMICTPQVSSEQELRISFNEPEVLKRLFISRDPLVLAEGYLTGQLVFSGGIERMLVLLEYLSQQKSFQKDLQVLLEKIIFSPLLFIINKIELCQQLIKHSPKRDMASIQQHYDLSNDFYKLWLDDLMIYSCAHFEEPNISLNKAQTAKLDLICRKLRLKQGEKFLDVGCGWGGLLKWAATNYGVQAYGITLSNKQLQYNHNWIKNEGFEDKVQVTFCDYRSVYKLGQFDKIVSVGMIEHVGLNNYPTYFNSILKSLKPGGLFLNHGITTNDKWCPSGMAERFINRYIFPDGELSTLPTMLAAMNHTGWEIIDVDCWRPHYAKTLRCWAQRLEQVTDKATKVVGEQVVRLWQLYLIGSAFGFERNKLSVYQTLLRPAKDQDWNLPMTHSGWLD